MRHDNPGWREPRAIDEGVVYNPILHDAHPDDLAAASDELRQRTMTLDPPGRVPAKPFIAILVAFATVAVVCTFKFRGEIRAMLGLS